MTIRQEGANNNLKLKTMIYILFTIMVVLPTISHILCVYKPFFFNVHKEGISYEYEWYTNLFNNVVYVKYDESFAIIYINNNATIHFNHLIKSTYTSLQIDSLNRNKVSICIGSIGFIWHKTL